MHQSWEALIQRLVDEGILKTESVIRAMRVVPREKFMPAHLRKYATVDTPFPIGYGQTISAPHMVAMMNEALRLGVGQKVLEVGAGSGYHAATIAEVVAPSNLDRQRWGHVYTVEIIPELVKLARDNLAKAGYMDKVTVVHADGSKGYAKEAPYDRILVTAAAPEIPSPLIDQLKIEGILVIPVGWYYSQDLVVVEKMTDGKVRSSRVCPVMFVPLRGKYGFEE